MQTGKFHGVMSADDAERSAGSINEGVRHLGRNDFAGGAAAFGGRELEHVDGF